MPCEPSYEADFVASIMFCNLPESRLGMSARAGCLYRLDLSLECHLALLFSPRTLLAKERESVMEVTLDIGSKKYVLKSDDNYLRQFNQVFLQSCLYKAMRRQISAQMHVGLELGE
jgi:hypothetical protein